jgi:hypothetical protein
MPCTGSTSTLRKVAGALAKLSFNFGAVDHQSVGQPELARAGTCQSLGFRLQQLGASTTTIRSCLCLGRQCMTQASTRTFFGRSWRDRERPDHGPYHHRGTAGALPCCVHRPPEPFWRRTSHRSAVISARPRSCGYPPGAWQAASAPCGAESARGSRPKISSDTVINRPPHLEGLDLEYPSAHSPSRQPQRASAGLGSTRASPERWQPLRQNAFFHRRRGPGSSRPWRPAQSLRP